MDEEGLDVARLVMRAVRRQAAARTRAAMKKAAPGRCTVACGSMETANIQPKKGGPIMPVIPRRLVMAP